MVVPECRGAKAPRTFFRGPLSLPSTASSGVAQDKGLLEADHFGSGATLTLDGAESKCMQV